MTEQFITPEQVGLHQQLSSEIAELKLEKWRDKAAARWPALEPVKAFLNAASESALMELAEEVASSMQENTQGQEPTQAAPTQEYVHVPAGSPEVLGTAGETDEQELARLREGLRQPDNPPAWRDYLNKKFEMAGALGTGIHTR